MKRSSKIFLLIGVIVVTLTGCARDGNQQFNQLPHMFSTEPTVPDNPLSMELMTPVSYDDIYSFDGIYGDPGGSRNDINGLPIPHNGIDFQALNGTPFIAAAPGVIGRIELGRDDHGATVYIEIRYNREYTVVYTFEPIKYQFVKWGNAVSVGAPIGTIGHRALSGRPQGQFVHFGVKRGDTWICPVPFFNSEVRRTINRIRQEKLRAQGMGFVLTESPNLCRCPDHQSLF